MQTKTEMLFFCKTVQKSFVLIVSEAAFSSCMSAESKKKATQGFSFFPLIVEEVMKIDAEETDLSCVLVSESDSTNTGCFS